LAEKIAKKLELNEKTVIECKNYEVIEGNEENSLWILDTGEKLKVAVDADEYVKMMELVKNLMKENFELRLEKAILSEFPVDYDDVKAVVLEEMKKDSQADIEEVVDKIKLEHPNLFYQIDLDKIF